MNRTSTTRPRQRVADLDTLEAAFSRTTSAKRIRHRILSLQRRLRPKLDTAAWRLYLALEDALNERQDALLDYLQKRVVPARRAVHRVRRTLL